MMLSRVGFTLLLLWVSTAALSAAPAGGQCMVFGQVGEDFVVLDEGNDQLRTVGHATGPVRAAAWSPDGRFIAHGFYDREGLRERVRIVDTEGHIWVEVDVQMEDRIRYVASLRWWEPHFLSSYSSVGKNGGYLDIWRVKPKRGKVSHVKRIAVLGSRCRLSPDFSQAACILGGEEVALLRVYDTAKREILDDAIFWDTEPLDRPLEFLDGGHIEGLEFDRSGTRIVLDTTKGRYSIPSGSSDGDDLVKLPDRAEPVKRAVKVTVETEAGPVEVRVLARRCPS